MIDEEKEYPPCKECNAEWVVTPAEHDWDVESAYLHHKTECEYAKKKLTKHGVNV